MSNDTSQTNKPKDPISENAILIRPCKGATLGLKTVKRDLKSFGCHWHSAMSGWSCPIEERISIETKLASKKIDVTITPIRDDYFLKSQSHQQAERLWAQVDFLEKKYHEESQALLADRTALENEIETTGLNHDSPTIKERLEQLEKRETAQNELAKEIEQSRNSARLLEETTDEESDLPFHVLGHNTQSEILIWKNGRIISLPAGRLNKHELRLYAGGNSEWFTTEGADTTLKFRLIDAAHKKGFIDDISPLRAGIWRLNGKWLVISGKIFATVEDMQLSYLTEPLFERKLIETDGVSWIDWNIFEKALKSGESAIRNVFYSIYDKVKQWNWTEPSMAAFITAFVMLSIMQQAMTWRPWIYLTGAKSTGKSAFFETILHGIYGGQVERLDKSTAHATAQTIGNSGRLPVFDEFEKHKHIPEILELAKLFNRGGQKTSGTGAEKANRYHLHHLPWFGSIYLPKRLMQDAAQESRVVKFELKKLSDNAPLLEKFSIEEGVAIATQITAAMILSWKKIETKAKEINANRHQLIQELTGIEIRTVENFMYASALLTIVAPEGLEEFFPKWATTQAEEDGDKLLDTILTSLIHVDKEKITVREMLQKPDQYETELERYGLKITMHKSKKYLALRCESITRHLLKDTEYADLDIRNPLARLEGAIGSAQAKIAGANQRCVFIPFEMILRA
jgi:hypothetical protein